MDCQAAIAGGGPAGLMMGYLLARAGVSVVVAEKHADFLRDFRGDTIHPSTMEAMGRLGLLDAFLRLPHQRVERLGAQVGRDWVDIADFSRLPVRAPFIAMMPQWDFLDFIADHAGTYPGFRLLRSTEATGLLTEGGRVIGMQAGGAEIRAGLVVAADGRGSALRSAAGLVPRDLGAPFDVLWFRLPRMPGDSEETQGHFEAGRILIAIQRGSYWQCAYVVAKGSLDALKAQGLDHLRGEIAAMLPFDRDRAAAIASWDDLKLLNVQVNRLETWWKPGFLCIGDAAHAMSPVGGVGVNLAVADAVAAANILVPALRDGAVPDNLLARVQARRIGPTRLIQWAQVQAQSRILAQALAAERQLHAPLPLRLASRLPFVRRLLGRMVGIGPRPEYPDMALFG